MILIWGSRLYGKVDEVPGLFHVATRFGHLWYVPLIPMGSHLVFGQDGDGWRGLPLKLYWKSVFVGWLRAGLTVGAVVAIASALPLLTGKQASVRPAGIALGVGGVLLAVAAIATWTLGPIRKASYERAVALADLAGLGFAERVLIERHFGRITDEQAAAELDAATRDQEEIERLKADLAETEADPAQDKV